MPGFLVWPQATTTSCPLLYSHNLIAAKDRGGVNYTHEHSIRRFKTGCLPTRNERDRGRTGRSASERCHTPVASVSAASTAFYSKMRQINLELRAIYTLSLSLSLSRAALNDIIYNQFISCLPVFLKVRLSTYYHLISHLLILTTHLP